MRAALLALAVGCAPCERVGECAGRPLWDCGDADPRTGWLCTAPSEGCPLASGLRGERVLRCGTPAADACPDAAAWCAP